MRTLEPRCTARAPRQVASTVDPGPGHPVRHPRHSWQPDRQEAAQPVERRLRRADHLLGHQPPGAEDPAHPLRPRPDPDEAVGDQEPQGRDREVQPQQVARDLRPLRVQHGATGRCTRLVQLERPRLPLRRADAAVLQLRPDQGATSSTFSKTWSQSTSKPPRFGRMAAGTADPGARRKWPSRRRLWRMCRSSRRSARASTSTCPRAAEPSRPGAPTTRRRHYVRCRERLLRDAPQPASFCRLAVLRAGATGTDRCWRPCRSSGRARCPACR